MNKHFTFNILLPLCFLGFLSQLSAQQTIVSQFYRNNWSLVNPAAMDRTYYLTFSNPNTIASASYREQWIGLEGAPRTSLVNVEHFNEELNIRFGGAFFMDQTDVFSSWGLVPNFSYLLRLPGRKKHTIHLGVAATIFNYQLDQNEVRLVDEAELPDILGESGNYEKFYTDFNVGALYRFGKDAYIGLSIPQLMSFNFQSNEDGIYANERLQHIYFQAGGFIDPSDAYGYETAASIIIEPSLWVRYTPGLSYSTLINDFPLSIDGDLRMYLYRKLWVGAGYSTNAQATIEMGYVKGMTAYSAEDQKALKIGLAFHFPMGKSEVNLGQTIELTASYAWLAELD